MNPHKLLLKQTSDKFSSYKQLVKLSRPKRGWIHVVREALGMTTLQLAKRLGVTQPTIVRLERSEVADAITIRSLQRIAEAMDCKLVYVLLPKISLEETVKRQAKKLAKKQLDQIAHHMALENQKPTPKQLQEIYQQLVDELLTKHPKVLWK